MKLSLAGPVRAFIIVGCGASSILAQPDPSDLFDPTTSSAAFDLAKTPLWLTLFQQASVAFKDKTLEGQFTSQFNNLRSGMGAALGDKNLGYLLKVGMYADESGTSVVPEGQIVFPVGVGTEPADALAEFIRVPRLEGSSPAGLRNMSYYIWVKRRDGKLWGGMIPREAREILEGNARDVATQRNRLGIWDRAAPDGLRKIQRDQYWSEVADKYAKLLNSDDRRRKMEELRGEFNRAETSFNEAYKQYQTTAEDLARQQSFAGMLRTVGTITSLMDNAIKIGSVVSTDATPASVKDSGTAQPPLKGTLEYTRTRTDALTGYHEEQRLRLEIQGSELQNLDGSLRDLFKQDKVPIPKADEVLIIPKP